LRIVRRGARSDIILRREADNAAAPELRRLPAISVFPVLVVGFLVTGCGRHGWPRRQRARTPIVGARLESRDHNLCVVDDAPGGIEKFLSRHGRPCPAIGAFEQCRTELLFKITQAAA
jgi:hypothetical protein